MAAEYTDGPGDRRDGEDIGREVDSIGPCNESEGAKDKMLRDAAAENGDSNPEPVKPETGNVSGDSSRTEVRDSRNKPAAQGFYKSQEEIDRAFGRRLAAERRRWERERRDERQQISENDTWLPQQQMYASDYGYFADLVTQAQALAGNCSKFDLMEELDNNTAFERMVSNGVPIKEAYETVGQAPMAEKEQSIRQDERHRIMEEMENRAVSLPPVEHAPGLSGSALDVTRISEEELTRLAERVRKGERVVI